MITSEKKPRAESVRQRRSSQGPAKPIAKRTTGTVKQTTGTGKKSYRPSNVFLPVEPRMRKTLRQAQGNHTSLKGKQVRGNPASRMAKNTHRNGYDYFAFNLGQTAIHAPTLSLPALGPRWVSAGLTLLLGILLYAMWTANTFKVAAAEVSGNRRLATADVSAQLRLVGQPIFTAVPAEIEKDLRVAFPDLAGVSVKVVFPNHVRVTVTERTPVLAWYVNGGGITWIDANGVAFMPRGNVQGLIQIDAKGNPPAMPADPAKSPFDQSFIDPAVINAMLTLYPQVPGSAPMIYDPKYGMGWQDPRGWSVYFGQNTQDIPMKQMIYQAILDTITQKGIQPTLISVAYLNAPFYK